MACLAQFYPQKYPANAWLLVGCVSTYALLSAAMTLVATVLEQDAIAFTQPCAKKVRAWVRGRARLPARWWQCTVWRGAVGGWTASASQGVEQHWGSPSVTPSRPPHGTPSWPASPQGGVALVVGSKLPRFQDVYTLRVQMRGAPKGQ